MTRDQAGALELVFRFESLVSIEDECGSGLGKKHRQHNESRFPFGFRSKSGSRLSGRKVSHWIVNSRGMSK